MIKRFFFVTALIIISGCSIWAQSSNKCSDMAYENKNQVDPEPLVVKKITGQVVDNVSKSSILLLDVCIGLFDEENEKLMFFTETNETGEFELQNIPDGKYRLVVKNLTGGYCTANIPVKVDKNSRKKRQISVKMVPPAIDECSYGELKDL